MPVIRKEPKSDLNQVSSIRINEISEASKNATENLSERNNDKTAVSGTTVSEGTKKYTDVVMARLSTGKRNIFKAFFAENGLTMNSGIEMCIEYVMDQVNSGNLKISKAGVK